MGVRYRPVGTVYGQEKTGLPGWAWGAIILGGLMAIGAMTGEKNGAPHNKTPAAYSETR
jgi:hypothetical protein